MSIVVTAVGALPRRVAARRTPSLIRSFFAIAVAIMISVAAIDAVTPHALAVLVILFALTPWIIAMPIRGLQVLLVGAIVVEIFPLGFPDSLTDQVPLFENLNNSLGLNGLSATPAELLMCVTLVAALARSDSEVRSRLLKGRLLWPYLLFMIAVFIGEVHGMLNGGDLNKSLWELRPQVYGFIGFVAASLLIRSREDVERLALIVVSAVIVKAAIGDFRYFIVLNHNLGTHETVLGHEDSYFLALVPIAALASLIWTGRTRTFNYLVIASLASLAALLANERRAGIAALGAAVGVVVVFAVRFNVMHRRRVLILALIAAAVALIFLAIFWNTQTGLIGQLVRPVRSQFDPTYRDYLSDIYRQAENTNLKLSFDTNRILGMGFGMPFLIVLTQADISNIYPLWNYIPHNTLLWVGVRMGLVGCATFWGLIGASLLEVCRALRLQTDRFTLAIVALAGAAIAAELIVAYTDLQLESYRNMIFIGIVLGLINVIPRLFPEPQEERHALA